MAKTLRSYDRRVCMRSNTVSASRDLFLLADCLALPAGAMFISEPQPIGQVKERLLLGTLATTLIDRPLPHDCEYRLVHIFALWF
jgi:hypothetical protein